MSPEKQNPAAVIITGPGFQDEEYVYPYYRLLEAGFRLDVATKDAAQVIGKYGVPARATIATTELCADDYDLVVLPGGFEAPDRVRLDPHVLKFVHAMNDAEKVVAAICHGPWICISARIVRGRRMTGYQSIAEDIRNAGAEYVDSGLVEDRNLITAPHYKNNPEWMAAVIRRFQTVNV